MINIPQKKLIDFIFLQIQNIWTIDGLYFLDIEKKLDTEIATEIDKNVWKIMGKTEARRLKIWFEKECNTLQDFMDALRLTSWALYNQDTEYDYKNKSVLMRVTRCRIQCARHEKKLPEFPCKNVRYEFLKAFAQELNKDIMVECITCPPLPHSEDVWCEWKFSKKDFQ